MSINADRFMVVKSAGRLFALVLLCAGVLAAHTERTLAADDMVPTTESIIDQLKMKKSQDGTQDGKTRSFGGMRGVSLEGPEELPSIDMHILFEFGSAELTNEAKEELKKLGKALISNELMGYSFELAGHTDAVGTDQANMLLSMQRAQSVLTYLVETFGIDEHRMQAKGYGESRLAVPQDPTSGKNRRVQVINIGSR